MPVFDYEFSGTLTRLSLGQNARGELFHSVIRLPPDIRAAMGPAYGPNAWVAGEISALAFKGTLMAAHGHVYIKVPRAIADALASQSGLLAVRFGLARRAGLDVPRALATALAKNTAVQEAWDALPPGKQRGHCYQVAQAKAQKTIEKRIADIIESL